MLTLIRIAGHKKYRTRTAAQWQCMCECGNVVVIVNSNLGNGTVSCGCYFRNVASKHSTTHGYSSKRSTKPRRILLQCWYGMNNRCKNQRVANYPDYGGRGIRVLWLTFEAFLDDMAASWKPGLSLDRIDNDGHYCKENCRWATRREQARNTSRNRIFEVNGIKACAKDLGLHFGVSDCTSLRRIDRLGWSPERAFLTPSTQRKDSKPYAI